jgi:hypothetical protein
MREAALWKLVRSNLPGHLQRIENLASPGAPDLNACYEGREAWIELKVAKGNYVFFRDAQIAWFAKRIKQQGKCCVLIRKDNNIRIVHGEDLIAKSEHIEPSRDKACKLHMQWITNAAYPKPFDWEAIANDIYLRK